MTEDKSKKEPTLEEIKAKKAIEDINTILKESNIELVAVLKFSERGIVPMVDVRLKKQPEPVTEAVKEEVKEDEPAQS